MYDPIVTEVRKIRDTHSKKFNYDIGLIVEDFQKRKVEIRDKLNNIKNNFNKASALDSFSAPLQKGK